MTSVIRVSRLLKRASDIRHSKTTLADDPIDIWQRAKRVGALRGLGQDADDFAGWLVMKLLEGKSVKGDLALRVINYRRDHWGDTEYESGKLKSESHSSYTQIVDDHVPEGIQVAADIDESERKREFLALISEVELTKLEYVALYLYAVHGFRSTEIAEMMSYEPLKGAIKKLRIARGLPECLDDEKARRKYERKMDDGASPSHNELLKLNALKAFGA